MTCDWSEHGQVRSDMVAHVSRQGLTVPDGKTPADLNTMSVDPELVYRDLRSVPVDPELVYRDLLSMSVDPELVYRDLRSDDWAAALARDDHVLGITRRGFGQSAGDEQLPSVSPAICSPSSTLNGCSG